MRLPGALVILAVAVSFAPANSAMADERAAYPTKPIRFIVPYPPGGGTDIVARVVGWRLSESLGQQVVIDNRGGANGIIGTHIAAKAAPDGYTMVIGIPASVAVNPSMYRDLPYHPVRDFSPVSQVTLNAYVLTAHPALPPNTVKELIELARSRPGQLNFGSSGNGSAAHLVLELFKRMANVDIVHVPYKGGGLAMNDLLAGQIQLMGGTTLNALSFVKNGKLKAAGIHRESAAQK